MSEVERILAGGFWKDEPPPDADAGAGAGGGSEPLSLYMRAKMRQEEREAEEALQVGWGAVVRRLGGWGS